MDRRAKEIKKVVKVVYVTKAVCEGVKQDTMDVDFIKHTFEDGHVGVLTRTST